MCLAISDWVQKILIVYSQDGCNPNNILCLAKSGWDLENTCLVSCSISLLVELDQELDMVWIFRGTNIEIHCMSLSTFIFFKLHVIYLKVIKEGEFYLNKF